MSLSMTKNEQTAAVMARLKTLRQENDELRAKLADPSQRDEKAIRGAYARGWSDWGPMPVSIGRLRWSRARMRSAGAWRIPAPTAAPLAAG